MATEVKEESIDIQSTELRSTSLSSSDKPEELKEAQSLVKKDQQNNSTRETTPCWLSCELRLDDFSIKKQSFEITGWINVFWIWEKAPRSLKNYKGSGTQLEDCEVDGNGDDKRSKMTTYKNSEEQEIVKIVDLRESDITYYLPIDANKIFYQPSLVNISHISEPSLYYNKETKLAHTQYYINVHLLEHLELFMFPFDRQFLNMKIRWNVDYYRILDFETEAVIPKQEFWWGNDPQRSLRALELYHEHPFKLSLKESLQGEVELLPAWIDFRIDKVSTKQLETKKLSKTLTIETKTDNNAGDTIRFALIRLRVNRNPMYFVSNIVFPFFIIVSCSFSTFFIDFEEIGDRLSVSVTILLTFTAFQTIINEELPHTSAMNLIDYYIGFAYLMQFLLVLVTGITAIDIASDVEITDALDKGTAVVLAAIWVGFSFFYMSLAFGIFRRCYELCHCCLGRVNFDDWERRASQEINQWTTDDKKYWGKIFRSQGLEYDTIKKY